MSPQAVLDRIDNDMNQYDPAEKAQVMEIVDKLRQVRQHYGNAQFDLAMVIVSMQIAAERIPQCAPSTPSAS